MWICIASCSNSRVSISPVSALAVRSIFVCRDILSFVYCEPYYSSHSPFPFQLCCCMLALVYLSAVVWAAQLLCCRSWISAQCLCQAVPASCLLRLAFPWCSLLAVWEKHSRLLRSSNIPHYLSNNAGNCPPPKAFCMTCFVCFALGLLSSGHKLALQGVFYLYECTTSSPALGPSCHQWDSSVQHPGWLPKEKKSSLISKPD